MYAGMDPGFTTQLLPLVLTMTSERVDHLLLYEVRDYDPLPRWRLDDLALGVQSGAESRFRRPGVLTATWGTSLRALADELGCEIDAITEFHDETRTDVAFDVPARHVEAGAIGAVRFGIAAHVDGVERLRIEHVNRLRRDIAPHWRHQQGYGVEITGVPNYRLHLELSDPDGRQTRPALFGTAMYAINVLPALVAAPPGIRSPFELRPRGCRNVGGPHREDSWVISPHLHAVRAGG
jgi:4-hydroxy-tetrahydrodipicolinate reductase